MTIALTLDRRRRMWTPLVSILLALMLGALLIVVNGDNPFIAYMAMFRGSLGSLDRLATTLAVATPLILTGLSVGAAFRTGIVNIGSEGQLYLGAFAAAWVGLLMPNLWPPLHVFLALAASMVAGGLWAWIFGWLRVRWNVNEIVTTVMGTYIAILFTSYLANYPFKPPNSAIGSTDFIVPGAQLPQFFGFSTLNVGFFIALAAALAYWVLFRFTKIGYEWRATGLNANFARYMGMNPDRQMLWAMFLSGALAGLAGAIEVLGVQRRFVQNLSPGYGYDGMLVSLLANNSGLAIPLVAFLFGILRVGGIGVEQATNVPSELGQVLQAMIILVVAGQVGLSQLLRMRRRRT